MIENDADKKAAGEVLATVLSVRFQAYAGQPCDAALLNALLREASAVGRDIMVAAGDVYSFEAQETIGTTPAHTRAVIKITDPDLMAALADAIASGRAVMDGDTIVSIDGVRVGAEPESKSEVADG